MLFVGIGVQSRSLIRLSVTLTKNPLIGSRATRIGASYFPTTADLIYYLTFEPVGKLKDLALRSGRWICIDKQCTRKDEALKESSHVGLVRPRGLPCATRICV